IILNGLQFLRRPVRHLLCDVFQTSFRASNFDLLLTPKLSPLALLPGFKLEAFGFQSRFFELQFPNSPTKFIDITRCLDFAGFQEIRSISQYLCWHLEAFRNLQSAGCSRKSMKKAV